MKKPMGDLSRADSAIPTASAGAHTPGPWAVEKCPVTPCVFIAAGAYPFGTTVCEVENDPHVGTTEGNARLIAAAPLLLAALKDARLYIRTSLYVRSDYTTADGQDVSGGLLARIDAAIAKATGHD